MLIEICATSMSACATEAKAVRSLTKTLGAP